MKNLIVKKFAFKILKYLKKTLPLSVKYKLTYLRHDLFNKFSIVSIEVSSACNRRCKYCPNSRYDRGLLANNQQMETELFVKIIDELSEIGWVGKIEPHFYNEPLLDKRLPELMAYARSKLPFCFIAVATNGDYLTIDLFKKLAASGVTEFVVSQHQKEEQKNITELKSFLQTRQYDDIRMVFKKVTHITSRGGLIELGDDAAARQTCDMPLFNLCINFQGEYIFCCDDYLNTIKLGNVKDEKLMGVWNKPFYKKLRKEVQKGIFKLSICKDCKGAGNNYLSYS